MKNLLRLTLILSVLFFFYNCTTQDEILEEETVEILLKKDSSSINRKVPISSEDSTNHCAAPEEVDRITLVYQEGISVSEIMRIRLEIMYAWQLVNPSLPNPINGQSYEEEWVLIRELQPNPNFPRSSNEPCLVFYNSIPGTSTNILTVREELDDEPTVDYY